VAREDVIEETPARLEAFLRAHEEGTALIRTQPDVAAAITARLVSIIDAGFVLDTYRISAKYCGALPSSFVEATMAFGPILQELGYTTRILEEGDVFDTRFLPRFHPEDPHYEQAGALAS
ncbi:MAG: ABC transporter substrate-binding protein, partial [Thermoplasmata archaeon]